MGLAPSASLHLCPKGEHTEYNSILLNSRDVVFYVCVISHFSCVQFFATLWTIAHQAPLSMGFSRQKYWSGLLCPPPGDLPNPGIEPISLTSPALAGGFFTTSTTWEACLMLYVSHNYAEHLKFICYLLYVSYISIKLGRKKRSLRGD